MSRSSLPACNLIRHSKGPATTTTSRARSSSSSELRCINIDDLPEVLLVEILCRLPCYKSIYRCKHVSQRWCTLLSDPDFICSFLRHNHIKRKPICTLINVHGLDFLRRMCSSASKPITPLFSKLMNCHTDGRRVIIACTYSDLVFSRTSSLVKSNVDDVRYYICNPYTMQLVPLPPQPPGVLSNCVPVGFTFDLPYFNYSNKDNSNLMTQLNPKNRCRVVRLIFNNDRFGEFKVQIFSSETGKWTESIVSPPPADFTSCMTSGLSRTFTYDGMLCWMNEYCTENFIIGFDPFAINTNSAAASNGTHDDHYKWLFIEFVDCDSFNLKLVGVYGGCLWVWDYNETARTLYLWGLKEEELHHKSVMINGVGKLSLKRMMMRVYSLDNNMVPDGDNGWNPTVLGFDPNNEDISYLRIGGRYSIFKFNLRTREWSKMDEGNGAHYVSPYFSTFAVIPWWPTPVPILGQHA